MFKSTKNDAFSAVQSSKTPLVSHYHPIRKLLVFQLKLALDAIRDILLSPISFIATIIDLIQGRKGDKSYFEALMKLGRDSETRINLFEQHSHNNQTGGNNTVDNLFNKVEDVVKREIKKSEAKKNTNQ